MCMQTPFSSLIFHPTSLIRNVKNL